ncbi:MAG: metallophosphoesterase [Eubacteriales bacterium]
MIIAIIAIAILLIALFCWWQNNRLVITRVEYKNYKLPAGFNGFKMLHLSDLHNKTFGKGQTRLLKKTHEISPDIIFITGDLIDARHKLNIDAAMAYVLEAVKIAPVYFAAGNHEKKSNVYLELKKRLKEVNVTVLDDTYTFIERNKDALCLLGVKDPRFSSDEIFENNLKAIVDKSGGGFKILLSHRPEKLPLYSKLKVDLVFSGHAHGGQMRLPFIGGLFSPHQGVFPKYTSGLKKDATTSLVISRGLGNSLFPLRVFNYPDLVVVTFKKDNQ